ncbi:MAG: TorF family putative porin [Candidatus Paceibacterota bacterium]|jgi:hypothetical protein
MKKVASVFLTLLVFCASTKGATNSVEVKEEIQEPVFTKTLTLDFFSKYVGPSGLAYTRNEVYQPSVTVTHESGLYLSVWGSGAFREDDKYGGNEIDYLVGWAGDVGPVSVDTGIGYYDFQKLFDGRKENAWAMFIEASKEYELKDAGLTLTPSLRFEENIPEPGSSYGSDFYVTTGLEIRKGVSEKVDVFFLPAVTYDNGIYGERCSALSLQCGVDISVSDGFTVKPTVISYLPSEKNDRDNEVVYGIGLKYEF